jgi:hypothetical protein
MFKALHSMLTNFFQTGANLFQSTENASKGLLIVSEMVPGEAEHYAKQRKAAHEATKTLTRKSK